MGLVVLLRSAFDEYLELLLFLSSTVTRKQTLYTSSSSLQPGSPFFCGRGSRCVVGENLFACRENGHICVGFLAVWEGTRMAPLSLYTSVSVRFRFAGRFPD